MLDKLIKEIKENRKEVAPFLSTENLHGNTLPTKKRSDVEKLVFKIQNTYVKYFNHCLNFIKKSNGKTLFENRDFFSILRNQLNEIFASAVSNSNQETTEDALYTLYIEAERMMDKIEKKEFDNFISRKREIIQKIVKFNSILKKQLKTNNKDELYLTAMFNREQIIS